MSRCVVTVMLAASVAIGGARRAGGQVVERGIPFDSAGRVTAVTPTLAERLQLRAPAWPVAGSYREARLYAVTPGDGFVLVVQRTAGALERTTLTPGEREALRVAVDSAMLAAGRPSGETGSTVISEPAGFAFARDQGLLGLTLYGPLAASLTDDGTTAGSAYLLVAGGAFFASYGLTGSEPISRAQSDLAQHLAYDFAGESALWTYALHADNSVGTRGLALAAAVTGTVAGLSLGRTMSDAESHAASAGITASALTTWGIATAAGATGRSVAAIAGAGGLAGYGIGLAYPRHASYTVTAGDVNAVYTSGIIGAGLGATFIAGGHASPTATALALTPAYLLGLWVGDRLIARPYDLSAAQGRLLQVGAGAGALMGAALPLLVQLNNGPTAVLFATAGAAFGAAATLEIMQPRSSGDRGVDDAGARVGRLPERMRAKQGAKQSAKQSAKRGAGLQLSAASAVAGVLSGVPGRYPVIRFTF